MYTWIEIPFFKSIQHTNSYTIIIDTVLGIEHIANRWSNVYPTGTLHRPLANRHASVKACLHWAFSVCDSWLWLENSDCLFVEWVNWLIGDRTFPATVMSHALNPQGYFRDLFLTLLLSIWSLSLFNNWIFVLSCPRLVVWVR